MIGRFKKITEEKLGAICLGASSIGLAIAGFVENIEKEKIEWFKSPTGIVCLLFVLLAILGTILEIKKQKQIDRLNKNIDRLEQENEKLERITNSRINPRRVVEAIARTTNELLRFSHAERISVFKYDASKNQFYLIARHSENNNFTLKIREFYEVDQGCIAFAWAEGEHVSELFPDYGSEPNIYTDIAKKIYKMNKGTIKAFSMKSRLYYGYRLDSLNRYNLPVGVVILETLNRSFPESQSIDRIKAKLADSGINELLAWSVESIPNNPFAEE